MNKTDNVNSDNNCIDCGENIRSSSFGGGKISVNGKEKYICFGCLIQRAEELEADFVEKISASIDPINEENEQLRATLKRVRKALACPIGSIWSAERIAGFNDAKNVVRASLDRK